MKDPLIWGVSIACIYGQIQEYILYFPSFFYFKCQALAKCFFFLLLSSYPDIYLSIFFSSFLSFFHFGRKFNMIMIMGTRLCSPRSMGSPHILEPLVHIPGHKKLNNIKVQRTAPFFLNLMWNQRLFARWID